MTLTLECETALPQTDEARAQWAALAASVARPTPFLGLAWLTTFAQHFARSGVRVLVARENGRLVAAAPFVVRRRFGARFAELLGTSAVETRGMGLADRADFLVPQERPELAAQLVRAILDGGLGCDALWLRALPADSPTASAVVAEAAARRWRIYREERSVSPYTTTRGTTWDAFLASRDAKLRRQLKNSQRRLAELGGHTIVTYPECGWDLERALDAVMTIARGSYKWQAGSALYQAPRLAAFYREAYGACARAGTLRIHFLLIGERPVAYQVGFHDAERWLGYDAAYLEEVARAHPGIHLVIHVLQRAFAEGAIEYDMMRGEEYYKRQWCSGERHEIHLGAFAPGLAGSAALLGLKCRARAKASPTIARLVAFVSRRDRTAPSLVTPEPHAAAHEVPL